MDAACRFSATCLDGVDLLSDTDIIEMPDGAMNETHDRSCAADSKMIDNELSLIVLAL